VCIYVPHHAVLRLILPCCAMLCPRLCEVCMGDLPTVDGVTWGDCIGNALPGDICTGTCPG